MKEAFQIAAERGLLPRIELPPVELAAPREKGRGDLASNIAMKAASRVKMAPARTAALLLPILQELIDRRPGLISGVEADPKKGFLNFTIAPAALRSALKKILSSPGKWGESGAGEGKKVLLEFVSANPTGPLTVAHGRQAAVGDSLARILKKAGFRAQREYYLNDRGRQMEILGRSVYLRLRELKGEKIEFPPDHYQGEYIIKLARRVAGSFPGGEEEFSRLTEGDAVVYCRDFAMAELLATIKRELSDFDVRMESFRSEKDLVAEGKIEDSLRLLEGKGAVYERDGALWFQASAYGDEKDRVLRKSDGELTYLTSDIAYHREKFQRGFEVLIDFWGPDHHGYIARLRGALAALGNDPEAFQVIIVQHCTLWEGKKQLAMSTRAGEFVSLRQVMEEVGKDAARYFFVRRRKESHLDFDLELARSRTNDNPVYYVQYAHARINSIFRKYQEKVNQTLPDPREADLGKLVESEEMEVIKELVRFPELVRNAALTYQPHLIPIYLEDLAAVFHGYYSSHRVISDNSEITSARLALGRAVQLVLAEGLALLGVTAPEKM